MGAGDRFWGKESVVATLMREQRASGGVDPLLVTFAPCRLGRVLADEGFHVDVIAPAPTRGFDRSLTVLSHRLKQAAPAVLHSHGYRANIVAKTLKIIGRMRGIRLVSTCHGWVESTAALRLYNALDRFTSPLSDVTTVPDPRMLRALVPLGRRAHVANGVPELPAGGIAEPLERFGTFAAGTLGRVSEAKGIADVLAAARTCEDSGIVFVVAGDGDLVERVQTAGPNVLYAGYFDRAERYLDALDVYVQASHSEGLSLALLEAMRAGKPIVATDVGATRDALTHRESALIVPARDPAALRDAVLALHADPALRERLGRNARARFEARYHIGRQHQHYLQLYRTGRKT
jgi:glycosyltransferase involved in cell wall biosynthesis